MSNYASAEELAGLPCFPSTARNAREAAARLGIPARRRSGRGGGLEYLIDALPLQARLALAARHAGAANDSSQPPAIASLVQTRALKTARASLATGWQKDKQDAVARVLVVFQRYWAAIGGQLTPAIKAFSIAWNHQAIDAGEATADLRKRFPRIDDWTLHRWYLSVQSSGLDAVTPPEHHRKGRYTALSGDVGAAVLALLIERPHLSAKAIYDAVSTQFENLPTERSFRRALAHWKAENAQLYTAATNPDAWRNRYLSAAGSASEGITAPNQLWQMDSTTGDVMLADGRRHSIVGVIDVYTRRRMFLVTRTSRSGAIMSLIRRAIAAWGVPQAIKTDNGRDYTAHQLDAALLGLGIKHPLCPPFTPQAKPHIERAIGALMHEHFELLDGYIGHSVADRKAIEARRAFSERLFDADDSVQLRMTPEQLQAGIDAYCERLHDTARDELGGRTPAQMAVGHPVHTVSERALDVLLASSDGTGIRVIGKKGIKVAGGHYNHAHLGGLEGRSVQVKVDEANLGRCWVFDLDGQYICEALDYARLGISSAEVAAQRRAHQAKVVRQQKRDLKVLTREFDTRAAIDAITRTRTADAVAAAPNVVALQPPRREVEHVTPTTASIDAAGAPVIAPEQLAAAQAALEAAQDAPRKAVVLAIAETPERRYARWLQLQARVERSEALSADERNWFEGYAHAPEWQAMRSYFEQFGLDADEVLTTSG